MFRTRFWPITASPINAISALGRERTTNVRHQQRPGAHHALLDRSVLRNRQPRAHHGQFRFFSGTRTQAEAAGRQRAPTQRPAAPFPPAPIPELPRSTRRGLAAGGGRERRLKRRAERRPGTAQWGRSLRWAAHPGFTAIPRGGRAESPPGSPHPPRGQPDARSHSAMAAALPVLTDGSHWRTAAARAVLSLSRTGRGGRNGARSLADPAQRCLPAHGATAQAWGARRRAPHPLKGTGVQHGAGPEPRDGRTEGLPKPRAVTAATGGRKGAARPRAAGAAEISSAAKPAGGRQAADLRFRHPAAYKPTDVGSRHPPRGLAAGWCCATLVSSLL